VIPHPRLVGVAATTRRSSDGVSATPPTQVVLQ